MKLQHLISINDLTQAQLEDLIQRAQEFSAHPNTQDLLKKQRLTLINLFYENSTRTRISFELAAKRLGIEVVNVDINTSSSQKGETILDTVATLSAMQSDFFVIRHQQENIPQLVAQHLGNTGHVINAGDGCHEHPTQALLDMLTIFQYKKDFSQLRVGIIGDIAHSRVANSQIAALTLLGTTDIRLIGPHYFLPQAHQQLPCFTDLAQGLADLDVVITLRVQKERITHFAETDLTAYKTDYCLTPAKLALAKPDAIVMHPGPINRGIEISDEVADGHQSVILQQVRNGVLMRMAVLEKCCVCA